MDMGIEVIDMFDLSGVLFIYLEANRVKWEMERLLYLVWTGLI